MTSAPPSTSDGQHSVQGSSTPAKENKPLTGTVWPCGRKVIASILGMPILVVDYASISNFRRNSDAKAFRNHRSIVFKMRDPYLSGSTNLSN